MVLIFAEMPAVLIGTRPIAAMAAPIPVPPVSAAVDPPVAVRSFRYMPNPVWSALRCMHLATAEGKKHHQ